MGNATMARRTRRLARLRSAGRAHYGHGSEIPRRDAPEGLLLSSARRGRGERRVPAAPAVSCALGSGRTHTSNNEYTGIARRSRTQWFYGLFRALVSEKSARICERAVLTNRPSLDLSPFVLEGQESLPGSVGQVRCLPQPEQLHGLRARTEQGRELDDGTKRSRCRRYRRRQG